MKTLSFLIPLFFLMSFLQAKSVFIKADLPGQVKVIGKYPCPIDRCNILARSAGQSDFNRARVHNSVLNPEYVAKVNVKENAQFLFIVIESPGYKKWSKNVEIQKKENKYFVDLGSIRLSSVPTPHIENIILSRHSATDAINYQIYLENPTDKKYTFQAMKVSVFIDHDFTSAGFDKNTANLIYQLNDELYVNGSSTKLSGRELVNNPDYLVPFKGAISFYENKDLIELKVEVPSKIDLPGTGSNYIQFELPKEIRIINQSNLEDHPMFDGRSLETLYFQLDNIQKTIIELKSTDDEIPTIAYQKNH